MDEGDAHNRHAPVVDIAVYFVQHPVNRFGDNGQPTVIDCQFQARRGRFHHRLDFRAGKQLALNAPSLLG